jgi:hypothetical protein
MRTVTVTVCGVPTGLVSVWGSIAHVNWSGFPNRLAGGGPGVVLRPASRLDSFHPSSPESMRTAAIKMNALIGQRRCVLWAPVMVLAFEKPISQYRSLADKSGDIGGCPVINSLLLSHPGPAFGGPELCNARNLSKNCHAMKNFRPVRAGNQCCLKPRASRRPRHWWRGGPLSTYPASPTSPGDHAIDGVEAHGQPLAWLRRRLKSQAPRAQAPGLRVVMFVSVRWLHHQLISDAPSGQVLT